MDEYSFQYLKSDVKINHIHTLLGDGQFKVFHV